MQTEDATNQSQRQGCRVVTRIGVAGVCRLFEQTPFYCKAKKKFYCSCQNFCYKWFEISLLNVSLTTGQWLARFHNTAIQLRSFMVTSRIFDWLILNARIEPIVARLTKGQGWEGTRFHSSFGNSCKKKGLLDNLVNKNQIINIIGSEVIRPALIQEVIDSKYFSVLCDEATSGKKEYMSMVLRFIDKTSDIPEEFVGFIPVVRTSGQMLAETILSALDSFKLDIANCRGQGYDGASATSSSRCGVQGLIRERNDEAVYFHCRSHCLNMVIVPSCKDISLQTSLKNLSEVNIWLFSKFSVSH